MRKNLFLGLVAAASSPAILTGLAGAIGILYLSGFADILKAASEVFAIVFLYTLLFGLPIFLLVKNYIGRQIWIGPIFGFLTAAIPITLFVFFASPSGGINKQLGTDRLETAIYVGSLAGWSAIFSGYSAWLFWRKIPKH